MMLLKHHRLLYAKAFGSLVRQGQRDGAVSRDVLDVLFRLTLNQETGGI